MPFRMETMIIEQYQSLLGFPWIHTLSEKWSETQRFSLRSGVPLVRHNQFHIVSKVVYCSSWFKKKWLSIVFKNVNWPSVISVTKSFSRAFSFVSWKDPKKAELSAAGKECWQGWMSLGIYRSIVRWSQIEKQGQQVMAGRPSAPGLSLSLEGVT